ncbi:MAG: glutamine-hydrolyzing carbamoyl-phosphate synthase small subunit, partial [Acetobacteraceae bacterium]
MPVPVDDILDRLGGPEAAARLTGVGPEAVRKWRQAHAIPARHWPAVLAATGLALADLPGAAMPGGGRPIGDRSGGDRSSRDHAEGGRSGGDRPGGGRPRGNRPDVAAAPGAEPEAPPGATAALVLADGTVFWGRGFGAPTTAQAPTGHATGHPVGEVCFSTGMTGYQETLTDPSFAGQIITFTFPHIGNVGANPEDQEAGSVAARGLVVKQDVTEPSNWRATRERNGSGLDAWLRVRGIPGIAGVDTRALAVRIRDGGAPSGVLAFPADGRFDLAALRARAAAWPGLVGMDLAKEVTCRQTYTWDETRWAWPEGAGRQTAPRFHVVAVDYGAKRNILRCLASAGCRVTVVPATASAEDILRHRPDGVFLSNGPGDPAATGAYAVPALRGVLETGVPVFGICLGHQLLALALGARTFKMARGHRGANQPVQDLATGRVEITSQNHGFAVDPESLPEGVRVTHVSLFDGTNEG